MPGGIYCSAAGLTYQITTPLSRPTVASVRFTKDGDADSALEMAWYIRSDSNDLEAYIDRNASAPSTVTLAWANFDKISARLYLDANGNAAYDNLTGSWDAYEYETDDDISGLYFDRGGEGLDVIWGDDGDGRLDIEFNHYIDPDRTDLGSPTAEPSPSTGDAGGGSGGGSAPAPAATAKPPVHTCKYLPSNIIVTVSNDGPQCQQVSGASIGNAAVLAGGVIDAVDVWSYIGQGVEVCIMGSGRMTFLDAAGIPRVPETLASYLVSNYTCAFETRAGTFVLQP